MVVLLYQRGRACLKAMMDHAFPGRFGPRDVTLSCGCRIQEDDRLADGDPRKIRDVPEPVPFVCATHGGRCPGLKADCTQEVPK